MRQFRKDDVEWYWVLEEVETEEVDVGTRIKESCVFPCCEVDIKEYVEGKNKYWLPIIRIGESLNKREYTRRALESITRIINSKQVPCYIDHDRPGGSEAFSKLAGYWVKAEMRGNVCWGILDVAESPFKPLVLDAIRRKFPTGVSIVGKARFGVDDRDRVVEDIVLLESVDIVTRPAASPTWSEM